MIALLAPQSLVVASIAATSLVVLAVLGAVGAKIGGAPMMKAVLRVTFWGAFAMGVTAGIGHIFGAVV
jgi:VIT1/CCC1 family predicted Fe2+/Mn2+ transporter